MRTGRSKFMLVLIVVAMAAYVPACCCWTQMVGAWFAHGGETGHVCCEHGSATADEDESHHESDGHSGCPHDHHDDCGCDTKHRFLVDGGVGSWSFKPVQVCWLDTVASIALAGTSTGVIGERPSWAAWGGGGGPGGAGGRSVLRQRCALNV